MEEEEGRISIGETIQKLVVEKALERVAYKRVQVLDEGIVRKYDLCAGFKHPMDKD